MAKIIIKRKSSFVGAAVSHDVFLVNSFVGVLKSGGVLEIPVDIGSHMISFRSKSKLNPRNADFNAIVNEENEVVTLKTQFNINGEYVVEYDDNKPHIPLFTVSDKTADSNTSNVVTDSNSVIAAQKNAGIRCPCCGGYDIMPISEVSSQGKDFKTSDACCGFLLCGPLGLLCGTTGKGKQISTTTYWICKSCGNKFKV